MKAIGIHALAGDFAEDKDIARDIRIRLVVPSLRRGSEVTLDFQGVESATQSFIHALLSDVIREFGPEVLDRMVFKHCTETVKGIINIVVDYMQS